MPKRPAHKARRRPGFFHPVHVKPRRNGWNIERQCAFLAQLYFTGSVAAAARHVGLTRESAHRLRKRLGAEGFSAAWDRVMAPPGTGHCTGEKPDMRKVTPCALIQRIETGLVRPVLYRGRMTAIAQKADNSALLRLLRRQDAQCVSLCDDDV